MLGICLSVFALVACGRGDVVSERPAIDATPIRVVLAFAELVGTWSGNAKIPSLGLASGVVTIDASGGGSFFVSVAGASKSGLLELLDYSDGTVRGRALGAERQFAIQVGATRLQVQVPGVGEVILRRSTSR